MRKLKITVLDRAEIGDILEPDETLLWTGQPGYGRKLFQILGPERYWHLGLAGGIFALWASVPFIDPDARPSRATAIWVFAVLSVVFIVFSYFVARSRQDFLRRVVYFVTDARAIVFLGAKNWRGNQSLYVVSCPHSLTYPYRVFPTKPYKTVRVASLLSEDLFQPFGRGLAHPGQPFAAKGISSPVLFEQIEDAEKVIDLIQAGASKSVSV